MTPRRSRCSSISRSPTWSNGTSHDPRLQAALHGAGVIGTWAGPRDRGTAAVRLMHNLGLIGGWGYVEGGMGRVSFALADAALEAGAVLACGVRSRPSSQGVGVRLEGGELIRAGAVVSNADPSRTLALLDAGDPAAAPAAWRDRIDGWDTRSPVVKLNCGLRRLPRFSAAGPDDHWVYRAMVVLSTGIDDTQAAFEAAERGVPSPDWCELYFQTAYDPTVAPPGRHTMSVFAQYAPYRLATGDWDSRRDEIARRILDRIALWAPDVGDCVEHWQLLGPPDVEARIGLTGGHIFQGSCLPDQMWDRRFAPARRCPASTCAAPPPTRAAVSSASTAATRPWPCWPTPPAPPATATATGRVHRLSRARMAVCLRTTIWTRSPPFERRKLGEPSSRRRSFPARCRSA